jgi:3-oxoacyl-[acyl-carrier protein] reductase
VKTDLRLDGKTAVVTGAAQGLGEAIAKYLGVAGARLALVDVKAEGLEATAAAVREAGNPAVHTIVADLGDAQATEGVIPAARAALGPVDILVNNAALVPPRQIEDVPLEEWDRVMAVNLRAAFILSRAVMDDFKARPGGRIINMASGAGKTGVLAPHYAASKAGLLVLTKTFATALGSAGATVNAIAPGPVVTDDPVRWSPAVVESLAKMVPLGRLGAPEEVAALVLFLASDLAAWITGQSININGGLRMD